MPAFRCDFEVKGDLALPAGETGLTATTISGHQIVLRNDVVDSSGHVSGLVCSVIGEAEDLEQAEAAFREILASYLDVLAFVTQSRFIIEKPRRLMDWEPGAGERRMKLFETFDASYPPERGLSADFLATVTLLESSPIPDFGKVALKYFRYGFLERSPEDQFMRLWLSLEVVAENQKTAGEIAIPCASCGEAMKCAACGAEPTRRPMAKDAITSVITRITGGMAQEVSKRQFTARNGLMHGRSVESIEKECKVAMDKIVNELGAVTWHAILSAIPVQEGADLIFGQRESFTPKSLVVSMIGAFEHHGDAPHPAEDRLPNVEITLITRDQQPEQRGT